MTPKLSVCIPVYNCAAFLRETLDAFLGQATDDLEIVVYDGGSTDGTDVLVRELEAKNPGLRYVRAATRGGIDADLASCVDAARGEFCWLFSGDDVPRPGALARVRSLIESGSDVYVVRHSNCTLDMHEYGVHPVLTGTETMTVQMAERAQRMAWFERCVNTEGFFSFLSGLVVRRDAWSRGALPEAFARSCWGHVARLFGLFHDGLVVTYVPDVLLAKRGENDSFASQGVVRRYALAIEGYLALAATYFGAASPEAACIRRALREEFGLNQFLSARLECGRDPHRERLAELDLLYDALYAPSRSARDVLRAAAYKQAPLFVYDAARKLVRKKRELQRAFPRRNGL